MRYALLFSFLSFIYGVFGNNGGWITEGKDIVGMSGLFRSTSFILEPNKP